MWDLAKGTVDDTSNQLACHCCHQELITGTHRSAPVPGGFGAVAGPNDGWHCSLHQLTKAFLRASVKWGTCLSLRRQLDELEMGVQGKPSTKYLDELLALACVYAHAYLHKHTNIYIYIFTFLIPICKYHISLRMHACVCQAKIAKTILPEKPCPGVSLRLRSLPMPGHFSS